jgi:hypothetical protein
LTTSVDIEAAPPEVVFAYAAASTR